MGSWDTMVHEISTGKHTFVWVKIDALCGKRWQNCHQGQLLGQGGLQVSLVTILWRFWGRRSIDREPDDSTSQLSQISPADASHTMSSASLFFYLWTDLSMILHLYSLSMSPRLSLSLWQWWIDDAAKDDDDDRHEHHWGPAGQNCLSLFHSRWCKIGVNLICPLSSSSLSSSLSSLPPLSSLYRHHCHHRYPFWHPCHQHHRHRRLVNTRSIVDAGWHLGCRQIIEKKSRLIYTSTIDTLYIFTNTKKKETRK